MGAGFKCASDLSQLYFIGRPEGDNRFGHGHSLKKEDILSQGHTELLETCLNPWLMNVFRVLCYHTDL